MVQGDLDIIRSIFASITPTGRLRFADKSTESEDGNSKKAGISFVLEVARTVK